MSEESPTLRDGERSEGGAGYGGALARCRFCESRISGDKEGLAAEDCVSEMVSGVLVVGGKGRNLVGGEGVEGTSRRSVVVDYDEECGVDSSEGRG